ncbi:putative C-type lectin domain family 20 member A [Ambystoma mexicanum]|uniref:putative C-type lectin domain family 20 member A n=1 Tax=Ambystoma mexicanum TaxID=8296 RepID=UPI0037E7055B
MEGHRAICTILCAVFLQVVHGERSFKRVTTKLSWSEARDFCRTNYADLADVEDLVEMSSLVATVPFGGASWIGLYYDSATSSRRWSTGATFDWMPSISSFMAGKCAMLSFLTPLPLADTCTSTKSFICLYYPGGTETSRVPPAKTEFPATGVQIAESTPRIFNFVSARPSNATMPSPEEVGSVFGHLGGNTTRTWGGTTSRSSVGNAPSPSGARGYLATGPHIGEGATPTGSYGTERGLKADAVTTRARATTNSPLETQDFGYLVLKVDFVTYDAKDLDWMKMLLLNTVQQLLESGLSSGSFQLKWVGYERPPVD